MSRSFTQVCLSATFFDVFIIVLIPQVLCVVFKLIAKVKELGKNDKAVRFDCLRVGVDLAILGIVSLFAIIAIAMRDHDARDRLTGVLQGVLLISMVQVGFLGGATLSSAVFDSPEQHYKRGIVLPFLFGWASLLLSGIVFFMLNI